jgi:hypothetical protein
MIDSEYCFSSNKIGIHHRPAKLGSSTPVLVLITVLDIFYCDDYKYYRRFFASHKVIQETRFLKIYYNINLKIIHI